MSTHYGLLFGRNSDVFAEQQAESFHDLIHRHLVLKTERPLKQRAAALPYVSRLSQIKFGLIASST